MPAFLSYYAATAAVLLILTLVVLIWLARRHATRRHRLVGTALAAVLLLAWASQTMPGFRMLPPNRMAKVDSHSLAFPLYPEASTDANMPRSGAAITKAMTESMSAQRTTETYPPALQTLLAPPDRDAFLKCYPDYVYADQKQWLLNTPI